MSNAWLNPLWIALDAPPLSGSCVLSMSLAYLMSLSTVIPLQAVTSHIDISPYLDFHFWEEVFVEDPRGGEQLACWCGPSHKQGDFLTYHVLLSDTQQLVTHSNVHHAKDALFPNRRE